MIAYMVGFVLAILTPDILPFVDPLMSTSKAHADIEPCLLAMLP